MQVAQAPISGLGALFSSRKGLVALITQAATMYFGLTHGVSIDHLLTLLVAMGMTHNAAQGVADAFGRWRPAITNEAAPSALGSGQRGSARLGLVLVSLAAIVTALVFSTACSGALVTARVSSTGNAEVATDFENLVVLADGDGSVMLREKQSGLPVWGLTYEANRLYVVRWVEPKLSVVLDRGEPIPAQYADVVRAVFTPAEIDAMGFVFLPPLEE